MFLASGASDFFSGTTLVVDGGYTISERLLGMLLDGPDPATGAVLAGTARRAGGNVGFDLTFAARKSVSVPASVGDQTVRRAVRAVHAAGVDAVLKTAGTIADAVMRAELTRALGIEWGPVANGIAELRAVPVAVREHFSARHAEIMEEAPPRGLSSRAGIEAVQRGSVRAGVRGREGGVGAGPRALLRPPLVAVARGQSGAKTPSGGGPRRSVSPGGGSKKPRECGAF